MSLLEGKRLTAMYNGLPQPLAPALLAVPTKLRHAKHSKTTSTNMVFNRPRIFPFQPPTHGAIDSLSP